MTKGDIITHCLYFKGKIVYVDYSVAMQVTENHNVLGVYERYQVHDIYDKNWFDIFDTYTVQEILKLEEIIKKCLSD